MTKKKRSVNKNIRTSKTDNENVLVHARISNPIFVRKTLLEGAIVGVDILKGYEVIKKLEIKKKHYRLEVKKILRDLKKLVNELETEHLPKVPHIAGPTKQLVRKDEMIKKEMKEQEKVKRVERPKLIPKVKTHIDALDEEIKKLQGRINNL